MVLFNRLRSLATGPGYLFRSISFDGKDVEDLVSRCRTLLHKIGRISNFFEDLPFSFFGSDYLFFLSSKFSRKLHAVPQSSQFTTTPREAVAMAQEVVKTMLSKGYILGKDALVNAKAFDESHQVSATAAAKVADLSRRIGLTDKISYGVDTVRSVDERYRVLDTTKTAVAATTRTASSVAKTVVNSSYFSAGALWVSDALTRAAKAAADLSNNASRQ